MDVNDLAECFINKEYDKVIQIGSTFIDSSFMNNYLTLTSMVISGDLFLALSFIRRSKLIKDNLDYLEEGGANYTALAKLSLDDSKIDLALMLFMTNFVNSVFKEELGEKSEVELFIRMNEMIDDLYEAGASSAYLSELTKNARLLSR